MTDPVGSGKKKEISMFSKDFAKKVRSILNLSKSDLSWTDTICVDEKYVSITDFDNYVVLENHENHKTGRILLEAYVKTGNSDHAFSNGDELTKNPLHIGISRRYGVSMDLMNSIDSSYCDFCLDDASRGILQHVVYDPRFGLVATNGSIAKMRLDMLGKCELPFALSLKSLRLFDATRKEYGKEISADLILCNTAIMLNVKFSLCELFLKVEKTLYSVDANTIVTVNKEIIPQYKGVIPTETDKIEIPNMDLLTQSVKRLKEYSNEKNPIICFHDNVCYLSNLSVAVRLPFFVTTLPSIGFSYFNLIKVLNQIKGCVTIGFTHVKGAVMLQQGGIEWLLMPILHIIDEKVHPFPYELGDDCIFLDAPEVKQHKKQSKKSSDLDLVNILLNKYGDITLSGLRDILSIDDLL